MDKIIDDIEVINNLALAVVRQAIDDWRMLCKMSDEKRDENLSKFNFGELEHFFKHDCQKYLDGTDISAERIYNLLVLERKKAERSRARRVISG